MLRPEFAEKPAVPGHSCGCGVMARIGIDLAKSVFQMHGVGAKCRSVLRRQLCRTEVLEFRERQPLCLIGVEACASAHCWAREPSRIGHYVWLMNPSCGKSYIKRGKTDTADTEAICEAVFPRYTVTLSASRSAAISVARARRHCQ